MQIVDEQTGLSFKLKSCFKLKVEKLNIGGEVKVSILGPRDGEHAYVIIQGKDLKAAIDRELS